MPELVLGPLLRYVAEDCATVWVETDEACDVEVLGHTAPTFAVAGHHYALVVVHGLEPASARPYAVALDGEAVWPPPGAPEGLSRVRTLGGPGPVRVAFGSCRVALPHEPPYSLRKDEDERGREVDALYAYVRRLRRIPQERWPDVLLLLGDQVYADQVPPAIKDLIGRRRDPEQPPGEEAADFEEYTALYRESWSEPEIRWLLSTVSTSMMFDDHDVHDDWNTSAHWVAAMRRKPWWRERILGAFMSYWVYQHLGNLSPHELEGEPLWERASAGGDITAALRDMAARAEASTDGTRWSFYRDLGRTRLVTIDSRAGRVLEPGGRSMVDGEEWDWIVEHATPGGGDVDHLLVASTLPILLSRGLHHLEAWNEAVCDGAWGRPAARAGEQLRQALDLEHWAAFHDSFDALVELFRDVGAGRRGPAPATIVALSGDVHHAYLMEAAFPRAEEVRTAIWQAVCSPMRNPLDRREEHVLRALATRPVTAVTGALARAAGVSEPRMRWRMVEGPVFNNQIATLELEGRAASIRVERALPPDEHEGGDPVLETTFERRLA